MLSVHESDSEVAICIEEFVQGTLTGLNWGEAGRLFDEAVQQRKTSSGTLKSSILRLALCAERCYIFWVNAHVVDGKGHGLMQICQQIKRNISQTPHTVETAWTEPNQMAINSCTTRLGVHGAFFGDVSMIHWIQSAYEHVRVRQHQECFQTYMFWDRLSQICEISFETTLLRNGEEAIIYSFVRFDFPCDNASNEPSVD